MATYEPKSRIDGFGCLLVIPTAIVGAALLIDDHVSHFQVFAEFLGWCTLCILVVNGVSWLLRRSSVLERFGGIAAALAFFGIAVAEARPNTPDAVKDIYTGSLLVLGVIGLGISILFVSRLRRGSYRT